MATKKKEKVYVIYSINNLITGKRYIGRTERFKERKDAHFNELKRGCHHNKALQNAWNKYNHEYFEIEIIKNCIDLEDSYIQEKKFIDLYGLDSLYNITGGGKDDKLHCSYMIPYTIEKCSKPIYQIDMKTQEIIGEYKNSEKTGEAMGVSSAAIKSVVRGITNTCRGYYWIRKEDYEEKGFNKSENTNKSYVAVVKMNEKESFLKIYKSVADAGRDIDRNGAGIRDCIRGKQKTCGGFRWRLATPNEINTKL